MSDPLRQLIERSNRIGEDPSLVVYGGGNTSAKGTFVDHLGRQQEVMWVKGSGADMRASIESDYPGLRLGELTALSDRGALSDEEMTDLVARALLDPSSRRPSIETLLHAFLPFTHIDHVHADAICSLTNHAEGRRVTAEALGDGFAYVEWMRPGFELSKIVGDLSHYDGVVLAHHGLITWADSSDACYQRTMAVVAQAQDFIAQHAIAAGPLPRHDDIPDDELQRLLLRLRGAVGATGHRILRIDDRLRAVADHPQVERIVAGGVASADHMLRIKPRSLVVKSIDQVGSAVGQYRDEYTAYVECRRELLPEGSEPHDAMPRVMLVPGLGAITTGACEQEAAIAADIAVHTHEVARTVLDAFGAPEPLSDLETFRFDYWPMELYKLTLKPQPAQFAGRIVIVTGAASGIGRGIALALGASGCSLVLADRDTAGLAEVANSLSAAGAADPVLVTGDQSDSSVTSSTVRRAVRHFGGLDGVVFSAGIGVSGTLTELTDDQWDTALRVNLTSAFALTREAMRAIQDQGLGGSLVYVASKNAFGPGAGFGAYSVSKAGLIQLMRVAALEGGKHQIRANAINPDAVFDNSKLWEGGLREERAAAHGIAPEKLEEFYASRNLLGRHVTTVDVAQAAVFLLSDNSSRTTGSVLTVDGGVAGAFPR
ncbi:MAG: bifunctional rhamnulose-1-phosphate aldolase/short-chain dehydrogenase [Actinobacteria bacterium]|nr:MAG: bifunctional rhamnulose-1-phosphate aldolase/short-chain dehydrogenase [Actinomycetota bacterium]